MNPVFILDKMLWSWVLSMIERFYAWMKAFERFKTICERLLWTTLSSVAEMHSDADATGFQMGPTILM